MPQFRARGGSHCQFWFTLHCPTALVHTRGEVHSVWFSSPVPRVWLFCTGDQELKALSIPPSAFHKPLAARLQARITSNPYKAEGEGWDGGIWGTAVRVPSGTKFIISKVTSLWSCAGRSIVGSPSESPAAPRHTPMSRLSEPARRQPSCPHRSPPTST